MKKKLLKSFAFVALGVFATNAYAQSESESEIQDAIVAVVGDDWATEGMVDKNGSTYILGNQSTHNRGAITSPDRSSRFPHSTWHRSSRSIPSVPCLRS